MLKRRGPWKCNEMPVSGFPTGVENMRGASSKFDRGGLSQYMGGA